MRSSSSFLKNDQLILDSHYSNSTANTEREHNFVMENLDVKQNDKNVGDIDPKTTRVGTRFYRAPEIILKDSNYGFASDVWAVGCILGELLLNFVEHKKKTQNDTQASKDSSLEDTFLFPGDSCYPSSPIKQKHGEV